MLLQALCSILYPLVNSNWSYSPETPNLGQIRRFLESCDLEIWRMTFKNNRAPLLSLIKLYASFHHHMWIQTGVTVRKRLSWVLTSETMTFDLWPWPFAWTSILSLVITPENFIMIQWWEHGEKGVTDGQTDGQTDGLNQSYSCLVAAKNCDDVTKLSRKCQLERSSATLLECIYSASRPVAVACIHLVHSSCWWLLLVWLWYVFVLYNIISMDKNLNINIPIIIPPTSTKLKGGYTGITLSVCPSVRLWTESCPLCIFNNTHWIHFIYAHLIKQLQKVCRV